MDENASSREGSVKENWRERFKKWMSSCECIISGVGCLWKVTCPWNEIWRAETDTETHKDNSLQNFCTLQNNPSSRNENIINLAVKRKLNFEKFPELANFAVKGDRSSQSKPGDKDKNLAKENTLRIKENKSLKDGLRCKICKIKNWSTVFVPCGHTACCENCALAQKRCPVCKKYIKDMFPAVLVKSTY